jgi:AcrR family transcriptional regulator
VTAPSPRCGRPRDPEKAAEILAAAIELLADGGAHRCTADAIAATARVGKASIYRRWPDLVGLFVDVVRRLGVDTVPYLDGPGTLREDLVELLAAHTIGQRPKALIELLPLIRHDEAAHDAYIAGPFTAMVGTASEADARGHRRGEPGWASLAPVHAGVALLLLEGAVGRRPDRTRVEEIVDQVVLPALATALAGARQ